MSTRAAVVAGVSGLVLAGLWSARAWIRCTWRGHHEPVRHPLGGFRCSACGAAGADLEEMGFEGSSQVPTLRRLFSRGPRDGGLERVTSWAEPERGEPAARPRFVRGRKFARRSA